MKVKKKLIFVLFAFCCFVYIFFNFFYFGGNINEIEQKARISQKIDENYVIKTDKSDKVISMLFYSDSVKKSEPVFSIYTKESFFKRYRFKMGGSIVVNENEIAEYSIPKLNHKVFISMNNGDISYYKITSNGTVRKEKLTDKQPFVFVIDTEQESIDFFDSNNNSIKTIKV